MARVTVEDCLDKAPNRFALVLMVSKRAKQLYKGHEATVPLRQDKPIVVALREVASHNVILDTQESRWGPWWQQLEKELNR